MKTTLCFLFESMILPEFFKSISIPYSFVTSIVYLDRKN